MFSDYVYRNNGSPVSRGMTSEELKSDYYTVPVSSGNTHITSVYDFEVGGKMVKMNTWSIPIKINGKVIGVVGVDIFIDSLRPIMENIKPFENTKTALFDHNGSILYEVFDENVVGEYIYDTYTGYQKNQILEKIKAGQTITYEEYSIALETMATYLFIPIKLQTGENWGIRMLVPNNIIFKDSDNIKNIMIIIAVLMLIIVSVITPIILNRNVISIIKLLAEDLTKLSKGDISWQTPPIFDICRNF